MSRWRATTFERAELMESVCHARDRDQPTAEYVMDRPMAQSAFDFWLAAGGDMELRRHFGSTWFPCVVRAMLLRRGKEGKG